jgi:cell pole-organizing protein PopZ
VTTEPREQHEPSMEEILSSIRRIIADEEAEDGTSDDDELGAAEAQAEALNEDADALAEAAEDEESEDVLELTRVVRDSGEVVDLKAEGAAPAEPAMAEPEPEGEPGSEAATEEVELAPPEEGPAPLTQDQPKQEKTAVEMKPAATRGELLSATAASAASGAFAKLSQAFQRTPAEESVADDSGRTVEQFIEDMIRPLLRDWLDENLPTIVDRLVEKEIQKIARRAELM